MKNIQEKDNQGNNLPEETATDTISLPQENSPDDFIEFLDKITELHQTNSNRDFQPPAVPIKILKDMIITTRQLNSTLNLEKILNIALKNISQVLKAERGFLTLYDDLRHLEIKATYRTTLDEIRENQYFDYNYITALVLQSGKAVISSDVARDERLSHLKSTGVYSHHSLLCAPLLVREKTLGTLYLENHHKSRIFIESDLNLLNLYTRSISPVIAQASQYRAVVNHDNYYRSTFNNIPIGVVIIAPDGRLATINQAALEIFDLNIENINGLETSDKPTNFIDILPVSEKPRWSKMVNTVLTTQQSYSDTRYSHNTGYLEKILAIKINLTRSFPYSDYGLIMLIEDVTEQVLMEKYVIFSEKLVTRGEMAAKVAHKLNNILTVISNNVELLKMNLDHKKYEKVDFNAKTVIEQVFKIKEFLENLVATPKLESGYISFNINNLINDLLFSLNNEPDFKAILYTLELADNLPNIEIDVDLIQQVLINLLRNAVEAIEERTLEQKDPDFQRRIRIATAFNNNTERFTITIADNGAGIKKKYLNKIFNQHFTTRKNHHGLGLYNCQFIVEKHHGRIKVDSVPGEGTTFDIILPRFQMKKQWKDNPD